MSDSFTLTVPADDRYRVLAPEVAAKYAELAGGSASDGEGLSAAIQTAIDRVVHGSHPGASVDLAFHVAAGRVEVRIVCEGRTTAVSHVVHRHAH